jgi:hypothetical protein
MMKALFTVLVADRPGAWRWALGQALSSMAYEVRYAESAPMLRAILTDPGEEIDLLLLAREKVSPLSSLGVPGGAEREGRLPRTLLVTSRRGNRAVERLSLPGVVGVVHRDDPIAETLDLIANVLHGPGPAPRYFSALPMTLVRSGEREVTVTMMDISGGGAQLAFAAAAPELLFAPPLEPGDMIDVGFSLSFTSLDGSVQEEHQGDQDGLRVRAQIRNLREEDGRVMVGVRFVSMSEDAWYALFTVLQHYQRLDGARIQATLHGLRREKGGPDVV